MTRRLSPLRRRRDKSQTQPAETSFDLTGPAPAPLVSDDLQPTAVFGAAGVATASSPAEASQDLPADPGFRDRGRYRRRLRYLRRVRELGFRDLGGLVFDQYRFSRAGEQLVRGKLVALDAVDRELRALERAVDDRRTYFDLREPGIAACPRCAGLHGSDARFCPSCGMRLSGPLSVSEVGDALPAPAIITAESPTPQEAAANGTTTETASAPEAPGVSAAEFGATPVSAGPGAGEPATEVLQTVADADQPTTIADSVKAPDAAGPGTEDAADKQ